MRVLTTGGAGYVGSVVTRLLLGAGHQVRVVDNLMHGGRPLLGFYAEDGFEFMHGDVRSEDVVRDAVRGVDAVVHLAAIVGDPACSRQPDLARDVNLGASLRLAEASLAAGVKRFVFASTCSNYGKMTDPSSLATEESELRPVSLYAETKVAVERALLSKGHLDALATVLRFSTVYGISGRMRFDLTVNEFTQELATKRKLDVYGEQFWRPYIHVRDAARAVLAVLSAPPDAVAGQVFNVGDTDQNYTKAQLIELICAELDYPVEIRRFHKAEDPRDYRVSFAKIHDRLGFNITRQVRDGIREILDMLNNHVVTDFSDPAYKN